MTDSYIFNKMFRTQTGLKFEASFLSHHYLDCFSNRGNRCNVHIVKKNSFRNTVIFSIRQ